MWHSLHSIMGRPAKGFMQKQVTRSHESSSAKINVKDMFLVADASHTRNFLSFHAKLTTWVSKTGTLLLFPGLSCTGRDSQQYRGGRNRGDAASIKLQLFTQFIAQKSQPTSLPPKNPTAPEFHPGSAPQNYPQATSNHYFHLANPLGQPGHLPESTMMSSSSPVPSSSRKTTCLPCRMTVRLPTLWISTVCSAVTAG